MKLWGGRFSRESNKLTEDFNASISFDQRMYKQDITGSIAHARMLGQQGIITPEEAELIINGLQEVLAQLPSCALTVAGIGPSGIRKPGRELPHRG